LTKNAVGKLKSRYLARGGLAYAMNQIKLDTQDPQSNMSDTLFYCGIRQRKDLSPDDLFKEQRIGNGYFDIKYVQNNSDDGFREIYYGFADEERKININALTAVNAKVLRSLIVLLGFEEETAKQIELSVLDWKDNDSMVSTDPGGAKIPDRTLTSPVLFWKWRGFVHTASGKPYLRRSF